MQYVYITVQTCAALLRPSCWSSSCCLSAAAAISTRCLWLCRRSLVALPLSSDGLLSPMDEKSLLALCGFLPLFWNLGNSSSTSAMQVTHSKSINLLTKSTFKLSLKFTFNTQILQLNKNYIKNISFWNQTIEIVIIDNSNTSVNKKHVPYW